jgi:hypothetical protein
VGGKSFKSKKKKRNQVGGGKKIKFQTKKNRDQGKKKTWKGAGRK